ncbi:hypothetical protein [Streptomyces inhibens]|uniref:hypothetical protein n=1 Tax=Streptomyces inhibens TaxID=2293571 RepID=UPI001EE6B214|nr:hypothetical protein [Streptomyces inhibens]UKY52344.1 hypothetical protein KI385_28430 [Streptomyces inhibens]
MPKIDHLTPCRPFLHPGEVLREARNYCVYPNLPLVPAHLRAPRKQSSGEKRAWGTLSSALDKVSRPLGRAATSRLVDNRLVNNPLSRAVGNIAEGLSQAQENFEDAVDDAAERMMFGKPMEGDWTSMAGRFHVQVTNAGGTPRHQAITDRRLFVLTDQATGWRERPPELELAAQTALSNIAELRPRPRTTFPRGRFDLVFVDGSWLALGCSFKDDMEALIAAFYGR